MTLVGSTFKKDVLQWESDYAVTFTEKPGETSLVEFTLEMGNATPIAQQPYMMAVGLREGVEDELSWLEENGYIVKSHMNGLHL